MAKWLAKLRNLLRDPSSWVSGVRPPFAVSCVCGQRVTGLRRSRSQIIPCPQCHESVFVLPASPWPRLPPRAVEQPQAPAPPAEPTLAVKAQPWLAPVLAGSIALALVAVISVALVWVLFPPSRGDQTAAIRAHLEEARRALSSGKLANAAAQIETAGGLIRQGGGSGQQVEEVRSLQRQIALLSNRLEEPLEDLLLRAAHVPGEEWQRTFQERYAGKSVILETWLLAEDEQTERRQTAYQLRAGRERGRLVLESPRLESQDGGLLLGGLLESIRLEAVPGVKEPVWLVRFKPTSVSRITDPGVITWLNKPPSRRPPVKPAEVRELERLENRQTDLPAQATETQVKAKLGEPIVLGRQLLGSYQIEQWCYPGEPGLFLLLAGDPRSEPRLWQPGTPVPNAH